MAGNSRPHVTVAVPTAGNPRGLEATIESALTGTFDSFEVLVSDAGRGNDVARLVAGIDDERVRYVPPEADLDPVENVVRCLHLGHGAYVTVVAPGAVMAPANLSRKVAILDAEPSVVLVHSALRETDDDGSVVAARRGSRGADRRETGDVFVRRAFGGDHRVALDTALWRRETIQGMEPLLQPRFDGLDAATLQIVLSAALHGDLAYLPDPLVTRPSDRAPQDPIERIAAERNVKWRFLADHERDVADPNRLRALADTHASAALTGAVRAALATSGRRRAVEILRRSSHVDRRVLVSRPVIRDTVKALSGPRGRRVLRWGAARSRRLLARG